MKIRPIYVLRTYPDSEIRQRIRALVREHATTHSKDHLKALIDGVQGECPHALAVEQVASQDAPDQGLTTGDKFGVCWDCRKFLGKIDLA